MSLFDVTGAQLVHWFQSTSSEEDVVSNFPRAAARRNYLCFNPRPPKRTLCRRDLLLRWEDLLVSIHVLRRGRCVAEFAAEMTPAQLFQSTSSEEDVVSCNALPTRHGLAWFQSTSSEEDVVSLQMFIIL